MELGKGNAVAIGCRSFVENGMFTESDLAVFLDLFEPGKAVAVRVDAGDDVVEAVTVDVIGIHLRAARGEGVWVFDPNGIVGEGLRLFPPGIFFDDVHASIAVDVANTKAMGETLIIALGCDGMEFPRSSRIFPICFGVSEVAAGATNDLGFVIAIDIGECRRFIINDVEDDMLLPMAFAAARIFIPGSILAGETVNQNVVPAVAIEIISEGKEVVGIRIVKAVSAFETGKILFSAVRFFAFETGVSGIILVTAGEVGAFIPVRA